MNNYDLSILIPARNEQFLARTIEDILENVEANTEIIATLDGAWAHPPIPQHERVNVIYLPESIGQRAATDIACRLAKGKYVAKVDAHTMYDKGFDRKMIEAFAVAGDDVTMVPVMKNLHAFDHKCYKCGFKTYQGPTPQSCSKCGSTDVIKKMVWQPRKGTHSTSYSFDSEPHFQYFTEYTQRPEYKKALEETGLTESMSLQGSFFMATREKYWELQLGGDFGSWGNQGLQVACATWLSGGRVLVNHNTWYAHMFRTQGGDFSFPYEQSGRGVQKTKAKVWEFFTNGKWDKQTRPVSWLIEKFWPITPGPNNVGWTEEALNNLKEKEKV